MLHLIEDFLDLAIHNLELLCMMKDLVSGAYLLDVLVLLSAGRE